MIIKGANKFFRINVYPYLIWYSIKQHSQLHKIVIIFIIYTRKPLIYNIFNTYKYTPKIGAQNI